MNMTAKEAAILTLENMLEYTVNTVAMYGAGDVGYAQCRSEIEALLSALAAMRDQVPRVLTPDELTRLAEIKRMEAAFKANNTDRRTDTLGFLLGIVERMMGNDKR